MSNAHQDNSHCQILEALNDAKLSFNKIYTNYQIKKKSKYQINLNIIKKN